MTSISLENREELARFTQHLGQTGSSPEKVQDMTDLNSARDASLCDLIDVQREYLQLTALVHAGTEDDDGKRQTVDTDGEHGKTARVRIVVNRQCANVLTCPR